MKVSGRDAGFLLIDLFEVIPAARASVVGVAIELHLRGLWGALNTCGRTVPIINSSKGSAIGFKKTFGVIKSFGVAAAERS